jgi:hypothetical protein
MTNVTPLTSEQHSSEHTDASDPELLFRREVAESMGMAGRLRRYMDTMDARLPNPATPGLVQFVIGEGVRVAHAMARLQSAQARSVASLAALRAAPPKRVVIEHRRAPATPAMPAAPATPAAPAAS